MIDFAKNINNPLLQLVLCFGEGTIRAACDGAEPLLIQAEMSQFADGRDAVRVRLEGISATAEFCMLFSNYFNAHALFRVARHAWLNRASQRGAKLTRAVIRLHADPALN